MKNDHSATSADHPAVPAAPPLVSALQNENRIGSSKAVFLVLTAVILGFLPFFFGERELFRSEGLYAICTSEYTPGLKVTACSVIQSQVSPLYPALTALVEKSGVTMENALRGVSFFMLICWSALSACAAYRRRNLRAGVVTFLFCMCSIFSLDKGRLAGPETLTAFFLLSAQLVFFHYGNRKANWNLAWLSVAFFLSLAFLSGGFVAVLFFIFPIIFLRRPLSLRRKYNSPGFAAGLLLFLGVIIIQTLTTGLALREHGLGFELPTILTWEFIKEFLSFPAEFLVRLMPWTLIAWLPFCVALQDIDQTPGYSRYLRTVFFSSFILSWLLPDLPSRSYFFIIAPLAIMTGINYDLGVRRYGRNIRKILFPMELVFIVSMLCIAGASILPETYLDIFGYENMLELRNSEFYLPAVLLMLTLLFVLWMGFKFGRHSLPVWSLLLMLFFSFSIFSTMLILPRHHINEKWRHIGSQINKAVTGEKPDVIYQSSFNGLYNALYYIGIPVVKLISPGELPADEQTVYLLSPEVPPALGRSWTVRYKFADNPVRLWRGELLKEATATFPESADGE